MLKIFGKKVEGKTESDAPITVEALKESCPEQYAAILAEGKAQAQPEIDALKAELAAKDTAAVLKAERDRITAAIAIGKTANLEAKAVELALAGKSADEIKDGLLAESAASLAKANELLKLREETAPPVAVGNVEDMKAIADMTDESARKALAELWEKNPAVRVGEVSKEGYIAGKMHEIKNR